LANALQDPEVLAIRLVQAVGLPVLFVDLIKGKTAGVVRHFEWSATPKYCIPRFFVAFAMVSSVSVPSDSMGMAVQNPVQVAVGHELWELAFQGALDLTASLAQLRLDHSKPSDW
jgi:hypothetical protein